MFRRIAVITALVLGLVGCESRQLHLLDADSEAWEAYRGRWVVINYWAEWCKPCREEVPELNRFFSLFQQQVAVLGVNFDQPGEAELRRQVEVMGVNFPVLMQDPFALLGYSRPAVLPTTLIFTVDGKLQHTLVGPQSVESLQRRLKLASTSVLPLGERE